MILLRVRDTHERQLHKKHTHTKGKKLVNETKKKKGRIQSTPDNSNLQGKSQKS